MQPSNGELFIAGSARALVGQQIEKISRCGRSRVESENLFEKDGLHIEIVCEESIRDLRP